MVRPILNRGVRRFPRPIEHSPSAAARCATTATGFSRSRRRCLRRQFRSPERATMPTFSRRQEKHPATLLGWPGRAGALMGGCPQESLRLLSQTEEAAVHAPIGRALLLPVVGGSRLHACRSDPPSCRVRHRNSSTDADRNVRPDRRKPRLAAAVHDPSPNRFPDPYNRPGPESRRRRPRPAADESNPQVHTRTQSNAGCGSSGRSLSLTAGEEYEVLRTQFALRAGLVRSSILRNFPYSRRFNNV